MESEFKTSNKWRLASAIVSIFFSGSLIAVMVMLTVFSTGVKQRVAFILFGSFAIIFYILGTIYYFMPKFKRRKIVISRITRCFFATTVFGLNLPMFFIGLENSQALSWTLFGISATLATIAVVFNAIKSCPWPVWFETTYYMIFIWLWIIALPVIVKTFSDSAIVFYTIATLLLMIALIFFRVSTNVSKRRTMVYRFTFNMIFIFSEICYITFMFIYLV